MASRYLIAMWVRRAIKGFDRTVTLIVCSAIKKKISVEVWRQVVEDLFSNLHVYATFRTKLIMQKS